MSDGERSVPDGENGEQVQTAYAMGRVTALGNAPRQPPRIFIPRFGHAAPVSSTHNL